VKLVVFALFTLQLGIGLLTYRYARHLTQFFPRLSANAHAYLQAHFESPDDAIALLSRLTAQQKNLLAVVAFTLVVLLPAALSACGKLADAATERIEPLVPAFQAVGEGRLEVLLEEGGSREFADVSRAYNAMVEKLEETRRLERSFSPYVSVGVMRRISSQYTGKLPDAVTREATILYVEIRGLLSFSQVIAPVRLFDLLNRYFDRIAGVIERYEGYVDKFAGDAIIISFNAPIDQYDHAERATRCGIDLQKQTTAMSRAGAFAEIGGQLWIAVAAATGPVLCGAVGARSGGQYAALGDTVHLASKLAEVTPPGQVWVNQAAASALPADLPTLAVAATSVRGKATVPYRAWPP
jgi:adenylate cyclase